MPEADYVHTSNYSAEVTKRYGSSGGVKWTFTGHSSEAIQLAVDTNGNVYTAGQDSTIRKISSSGSQQWSHSTTSDVNAITLDLDGGYVYAASGQTNYQALDQGTLVKLDLSGNVVWEYGNDERQDGVAVDSNGNAYLVYYSGNVAKIDSTGSSEVWNKSYSANAFQALFGDDGYLYVGIYDGLLKVDPSDGSVVDDTGSLSGTPQELGWGNGNVFFGSKNGDLFKVSTSPVSKEWTFSKHSDDVNGVAADSAGHSYTASQDETEREIDSTGSEVWSVTGGFGRGAAVKPPPSNTAPTADFTFTKNGGTVDFTDQSSDPDGSISSWDWDFGDGNSSTQQSPSHTYSSSGTYTVQLTVTDDAGATDTTSQDITASVAVSGTAAVSDAGQTVSFSGTVPITASSSLTDKTQTLSTSAAAPTRSTAAISDSPQSASAEGAVVAAGTSGFTSKGEVVDGAGSVTLAAIGELDVTDAQSVVSARARAAVGGQSTLVDFGQNVTSSGLLLVSGTAQAADRKTLLELIGAPIASGSGATVDQAALITGEGGVLATGPGRLRVFDKQSALNAAGNVSLAGSGALQDQAPSTDASGTAVASSTLSLTGAKPAPDGDGNVLAGGNADLTDGRAEVASSGDILTVGTVSTSDAETQLTFTVFVGKKPAGIDTSLSSTILLDATLQATE